MARQGAPPSAPTPPSDLSPPEASEAPADRVLDEFCRRLLLATANEIHGLALEAARRTAGERLHDT